MRKHYWKIDRRVNLPNPLLPPKKQNKQTIATNCLMVISCSQ